MLPNQPLAHRYKIVYDCGHVITYEMYPNLIVEVGDLAMCYECGLERKVVQVDDQGLAYKPEE